MNMREGHAVPIHLIRDPGRCVRTAHGPSPNHQPEESPCSHHRHGASATICRPSCPIPSADHLERCLYRENALCRPCCRHLIVIGIVHTGQPRCRQAARSFAIARFVEAAFYSYRRETRAPLFNERAYRLAIILGRDTMHMLGASRSRHRRPRRPWRFRFSSYSDRRWSAPSPDGLRFPLCAS